MLNFALSFTFTIFIYVVAAQEIKPRIDKDLHFVVGWAIGLTSLATIILAIHLFQW